MNWDSYSDVLFEDSQLTEEWISKCAAYLEQVFGRELSNEIVLDYGFGRGNWSLAFAQLKAKQIFAVDISFTNIKRFTSFLSNKKVFDQITCLESDYQGMSPHIEKHSLIWIYGVLQHLKDPGNLFKNLSRVSDKPVSGLVYAYEKGSIRYEIIEAFRQFLVNPLIPTILRENKARFVNQRAYNRCVDDYCAPTVKFFDELEVRNLIEYAFPSSVIERVPSFMNFLGDDLHEVDFSAIHLRFTQTRMISEQMFMPSTNLYVNPNLYEDFRSRVRYHVNQNESWKLDLLIDFHNSYYSCTSVKEVFNLLETYKFH